MRTLVTGATGLIGRELVRSLGGAVVLSRNAQQARELLGEVEAHVWRGGEEAVPTAALEGVEAVFHLAGEPIAEGRWTQERKRRIRESRVLGTRRIVEGLALLERRPNVLVSGSAVGIYGDRGDEKLDEYSACGQGFLAEVCAEWEQEARRAEELGIRVVCVRTGIVLASSGGALERMLTPFRLGAGGRLGDGSQWMPWVHLEDEVGILLHAAATRSIRGPLNAVGPQPVTNARFTLELSKALHRPALVPVPKAALRLAFGEMSQVLTASQRVLPTVAGETGYRFKYATLDSALAAVLG